MKNGREVVDANPTLNEFLKFTMGLKNITFDHAAALFKYFKNKKFKNNFLIVLIQSILNEIYN